MDAQNSVLLESGFLANSLYPVASTDIEGIESLEPRMADRIWRLNNIYTVVDENGQLVKFKLRPAQEELLKNLHYRNIILKARQLGFTTFICIFLLDFALFNSNKQVGIVAQTDDAAKVIFRKVKVAWENLNPGLKAFLKISTVGDSKTEYEFSNGSIMRIATSIRSATCQALLVTEFGKICARFDGKAEEIITGTLPAVPANGLVFIESTAEGEIGSYYDMVQEAIRLKAEMRPLTMKDYKYFFFAWFQNPANVIAGPALPIDEKLLEYFKKIEEVTGITLTQAQKNWYWLELKTQKNKMTREHPSTADEAFFSSGNKLFSAEVLDLQKTYTSAPYRVDGDFKYFRPYVRGHNYGLGADVSSGLKLDHSTMVVIDFTTGEVAMTYKSNQIDPVSFAYDIKKAALEYGGCVAAPESNTIGQTTCITLNNIYNNVYTEVRAGFTETIATKKLGFNTNGNSKPQMMYELSEAVTTGDLKITDFEILQEARKYNKEDSLDTSQEKTEDGKTTKHFDLLMATAIANQMKIHTTRGTAPIEDQMKVEERRAVHSKGRSTYR